MGKTFGGTILGVGLAWCAFGWGPAPEPRTAAYAQQGDGERRQGQEWITLSSPLDNERHQVVLLDPRSRTMAVYHLARTTGEISLKSVRNVSFDLQLSEYNTQQPLPKEIKALLQKN